jgi:hypothetical protein
MRTADVARVVGDAGGPTAYVMRALELEHQRNPRTTGELLDEVVHCGGLRQFAAVIVADRLVIETLGDVPGVHNLTLALDHGHALLVALDDPTLADAVAGVVVSP